MMGNLASRIFGAVEKCQLKQKLENYIGGCLEEVRKNGNLGSFCFTVTFTL